MERVLILNNLTQLDSLLICSYEMHTAVFYFFLQYIKVGLAGVIFLDAELF